MAATLVDILFGMFMAAAGAVSVPLCRGYARRRTSCDTFAEVRRAREIMTRLHQWTLNMTADVCDGPGLADSGRGMFCAAVAGAFSA